MDGVRQEQDHQRTGTWSHSVSRIIYIRIETIQDYDDKERPRTQGMKLRDY